MIKFAHNPTDSVRITSPFGMRTHPITREQKMHNGIDIGATKPNVDGDSIYAVADGKVIINKVNNGGVKSGYGYYLVIQHDGFASLYGHLEALSSLKIGQAVNGGEQIALMGTTGTSTSTHLHFGVTNGEYGKQEWINPQPYLLTKGKEDMDIEQAILILKENVGLAEDTIQYLSNYKYGKDLIVKLARAVKK